MPHPPTNKDRPLFFQWLLKPWFWVALGLHGVLLFLPLPSEPPPIVSTVDDINLVTLPPSPTLPTIPRRAIASPSPVAIATPAAPPVTPLPTLSRPTAPPPVPAPTATTTPTPTSDEGIPSPTPTTLATPPATPPEPQPTITPQSSVPNPPNFPHLSGSQPGCGGQEGCWQITGPGSRWRNIAITLEQDLKTQGYTLHQLQLADDTGLRIYEVSKTGETSYYLNFVSTLEGTVYVFSNEPLTAQQLNEMIADQEQV